MTSVILSTVDDPHVPLRLLDNGCGSSLRQGAYAGSRSSITPRILANMIVCPSGHAADGMLPEIVVLAKPR